MKYIDAEKLKWYLAELKKAACLNHADKYWLVPKTLTKIEQYTDSLQQKSEVEFEKEIDVFFYGKNFKRCNDGVRVPGALMRDWQNQNVSRSLSTDEIRRFASHFYELGINARKEE